VSFSYPDSGLDRLADIERDHFWFVARRRVIADAMARLSLGSEARVLDAGCGTGANIAALRPNSYSVGVDPFSDHLARSLVTGGPSYMKGDIRSLAIRDSSIDLAMGFDVLEHVDDLAALRELNRVVKPGGSILVTVPAMPRLWSQRDVDAGHLRRYTKRSLKTVISKAGLETQRCVPFNSVLMPLVAASRLIKNGSNESRDRENNPSGLVNKVLTAVSMTEARLINKGLRPPVGTSLLALISTGT